MKSESLGTIFFNLIYQFLLIVHPIPDSRAAQGRGLQIAVDATKCNLPGYVGKITVNSTGRS